MRPLSLCLLGMVVFASAVLAANEPVRVGELTLAQAINKSGRQRMLTQRIAKCYVQIGQGIEVQAAQRQLAEAVALFDTQLEEIRRFASDARGRQSVERLDRVWRPFKMVATGAVNRAGAGRLTAMEEELVGAAHELTSGLQNRSAAPAARLVNISGRQRMLSQRLAKLYLMLAWGIEHRSLANEIGSAREEFDGALAALRAAPQNTPAIRNELEAVGMQWEWFQHALGLAGAASYALIVLNASEAILGSMELVVSQYEALLAR